MAHFYTRSVDECIELIGTTLPGAGWNLTGNTNLFYGMVSGAAGKGRPTPALALLSALLKALIAREEQRAGEEKEVEPHRLVMAAREMRGLYATLTPEQQKAALAYDGPEDLMPAHPAQRNEE